MLLVGCCVQGLDYVVSKLSLSWGIGNQSISCEMVRQSLFKSTFSGKFLPCPGEEGSRHNELTQLQGGDKGKGRLRATDTSHYLPLRFVSQLCLHQADV